MQVDDNVYSQKSHFFPGLSSLSGTGTYCNACNGIEISAPINGEIVVTPINSNCNAVLYYRIERKSFNVMKIDEIDKITMKTRAGVGNGTLTLEIVVGRTSAEGIEKSQ
jgi:hypothetical protein